MSIHISGYLENTWASRLGASRKIYGIVLAAGLGKRLQPFSTQYLPKPMFTLGGAVPILETWLQKFAASGITRVSLNLCVMPQVITNYLQNGLQYLLDLNFYLEQEPSGTLGGVCKMIAGKECETVMVVSGDIATDISPHFLQRVYELHTQTKAGATIVLVPVPWERRKDYGVALLDTIPGDLQAGYIRQFFEKQPDAPSNLNNASIYFIEKSLLDEASQYLTPAALNVAHAFYDFGKHFFPSLLGVLPYKKLTARPMVGVVYPGKWFDIGTVHDYLDCSQAVLRGELDFLPPYKRYAWGFLGHGVQIDFSQTNITGPVLIGHHCVIEPGASLGPDAVIEDGWHIGKGSKLTRCILWQDYSNWSDLSGNNAKKPRQVAPAVEIDTVLAAEGILAQNLKNVSVTMQEGKLQLQDIAWECKEKRV